MFIFILKILFSPFFKERKTLFIIFTHQIGDQSVLEVEFVSEDVVAKRVPGTVENEYTISVAAPGKYRHEIMCTSNVFQQP